MFLKSGHVIREHVQSVQKQIYDNSCFILKKNESVEQTQVETLYLLIMLSELGRDYWLEENVLCDYLGIGGGPGGGGIGAVKSLNYFSITVAMFYMRDKIRYKGLRTRIIDAALQRIRSRSETCHKDAELVFLLFDLVSCPYVDEPKKLEALEIFGVSDPALATDIITFSVGGNRPQLWFTNWLDFDIGKELDAKRSQEVY